MEKFLRAKRGVVYGWSMASEEAFIRRLGSHAMRYRQNAMTHEELVEMYLKVMPLRKNWDGLDPKRLREVCEEELALCRKAVGDA